MHYRGKNVPFSRETFDKLVPLSPKEYRKRFDAELNEVRAAAGLPAKRIYERDAELRAMQSAAGII
jgi:hypothetical protein